MSNQLGHFANRLIDRLLNIYHFAASLPVVLVALVLAAVVWPWLPENEENY